MATTYPTSIDNFSDPVANNKLNSPSHSTQHANINDAVEALETKLGVNSSGDASSIEYILRSASSIDPGHSHTSAYISGLIAVSKGGTGAGTLTGIVKGNGTSAFTAVTAPTGTIVGTSDAQTLTNKNLTSPTITAPTITGTIGGNPAITKPTLNGTVGAYTSDTDGATITFDMTASNIHNVTLGNNRTLAVSNVSTGQAFIIILKQDATGSRTVTWFSGIKWVGATAPTLTTTASRWDIFAFIYDGTNYYGSIVGQNFG